MDVARNEIRDALEARSSSSDFRQLPQDQRRKIVAQLYSKQAAPYAHESNRYMSGLCLPMPKTNDDAETECEIIKAQFQRNYGLALKGDYEAQREVAFCLGSTRLCDGIVIENIALGCAWQIVSLASGDKRVIHSDIVEYESRCVRNRTPAETAVSRAQAEALFERIFHRPLPSGF